MRKERPTLSKFCIIIFSFDIDVFVRGRAMQGAGMEVLRVWLDGQSGTPKVKVCHFNFLAFFFVNSFQKVTPIQRFAGPEPGTLGLYDDTALENLDGLVVFGIKVHP